MKSIRKISAAGSLLLVSGTLLYAQPSPVEPAQPTVTAEQQAQISPEEMQKTTAKLAKTSAEHNRHVTQLAILVRKQKDVIKLNCVNDKHLQIKALLNLFDEAKAALEAAIGAGDDDARYHEFSKITIGAEKVRVLRDEADACVGEELTYLGETLVEVDGPDIADEDLDDPFGDGIEPPGYASPFN